jgi:enamine deaminase RidA (YjgF/YER057c/UK114 family)
MEVEKVSIPAFEAGFDDRVWSPGIKVGPWVFLSGVVSYDYEAKKTVGISGGTSMTPGSVDPAAQWRQVLTNIKDLVEAAGGTMRNVVKAHVFVTDISYYYDYQHIRGEFFEEPYPICTALEVSRLVHPDWILEIEAEAYIPENS